MRFALSILALSLVSGDAFAQEYRPRILLLFDTSGSMGIDVNTGGETGGDNSEEHPGNGGLSRLSVAKSAIQGVIETTAVAEFALMRYPQLEAEGLNRGDVDGFNRNSYAGLAQNPLNYAGVCEGQLRRGRADEGFSLIAGFAPNNDLGLLRWLDHRENYPRNKELRATGPTPIAESLRLAREYFQEILPDDPGIRCRRNVVVLLTDGSESCIDRANREAELERQAQALRSIRVNQNGIPYDIDVRTFVLAFAVNQTAINQLSVVARAGGTAVHPAGFIDLIAGEPFQASDPQSLRVAFSRILNEAIPREDCNGIDDDCNGRIDEGVRNACGECGEDPEEICNGEDEDCDGRIDEGVLNACGICGETPVEVCNDADDDCDGRVDEDVVNACGGCAGVQAELCNGLDDDCDGRIDNEPGTDRPIRRPCSSDIGVCTLGASLCEMGAFVGCDGVLPADETCNGLDDDCDGVSDEIGVPCGPAVELGDVGECRVGVRRCVFAECAAGAEQCDDAGFNTECIGDNGPSDEVCDGRDNDCDGEADEGLFNACGTCGELPPEACNGRDDNCDGRVDEDAICPSGYLCVATECVLPCIGGECTGASLCTRIFPGAGYCHPRICDVQRCNPGTVCDTDTGRCIDPCIDVQCETGESCVLGECMVVGCSSEDCPASNFCIDGECIAHLCADVVCEDGEFCREGNCYASCQGVECAEGESCYDGDCVEDPCGGRCLRGSVCDPEDGACVLDRCNGIACPRGTACEDGRCQADAACAGVECPLGLDCLNGTCTDRMPTEDPRVSDRPDIGIPDMMASEDAGVTVDATPIRFDAEGAAGQALNESEGCACNADPSGHTGGGTLLLMLIGMACFRRHASR